MCLSSTAEGCVFHAVGQPLSAEWPDMLIIGCFHRPPLRLMRLHHQLLGFCIRVECCWERRHPVSLLIPPSLIFPSAGQERSVRAQCESWSSQSCVCWLGHTEWVCEGGCLYGCDWLHADLGPWPDGKERQEAGIFCQVRDSLVCVFCLAFV